MIDRRNRGLYIGDVCARFDGDPWVLMSDIRGCVRDFRCENYGYPPSFLLVDGEGDFARSVCRWAERGRLLAANERLLGWCTISSSFGSSMALRVGKKTPPRRCCASRMPTPGPR